MVDACLKLASSDVQYPEQYSRQLVPRDHPIYWNRLRAQRNELDGPAIAKLESPHADRVVKLVDSCLDVLTSEMEFLETSKRESKITISKNRNNCASQSMIADSDSGLGRADGPLLRMVDECMEIVKSEVEIKAPLYQDPKKEGLIPKRKRKPRQRKKPLRHPPLELDEPIKCKICNAKFTNNVDFAIHSMEHSSDHKYHCHMCKSVHVKKDVIKTHILQEHDGIIMYKCEICEKPFKIKIDAVEHKNTHNGGDSGVKQFQCELCGKQFMFSRYLRAHRYDIHSRIVTGELRIHECVECNKQYKTASGLFYHNTVYHTATPLDSSNLCEICGNFIRGKEAMKLHLRLHIGYKPFSCGICKKSFSHKGILKSHKRSHTGERPFSCKVCDKQFSQTSTLKMHERLHTGERPHVCSICEKGFVRKASLILHIKTCQVD